MTQYKVTSCQADLDQGSEYIHILVEGPNLSGVYMVHETNPTFQVGAIVGPQDLTENDKIGFGLIRHITDKITLEEIARETGWDI
ncbi:TPA: hypothetical protein HA278_00700 [Candidatus Woesearchaeota archaeon]|nr:hypothetical protein [Candidatus Woesearchaeota archaeon]|tara:strand:- start:56 stop:310 length:255 start_codon:yes stop_codon:yes gene_type:complete